MRFHYIGALVIAGCGEPAVEAVEYDDVARMVGATIATAEGGGTMGAIGDSLVLAFGGIPMGFTHEAGMVAGHHGALEHKYIMIQCRDPEGGLLKECSYETNLATVTATWSGPLRQPGLDLWSGRQGMWTLSNLQQWVPTLTGTSQLQSSGTVGDRAYELTAAETEAMVAPSYMMGGTLRLELTVTRGPGTETPTVAEIEAEVAFDDAMRSASLTLDGVHLYRVDLATGVVEM